MLGRLRKAQPRIPDQLVLADAGRQGRFRGQAQLPQHPRNDTSCAVINEAIHRLAIAAGVHQDVGAAGIRHHLEDLGISASAADVIDPIRTGFEGCCRDGGAIGVDRDQGRKRLCVDGRANETQAGEQTSQLFR